MGKKFEEYYDNGNLKRTGFKNEHGNIDGYVITYNEDGTEKEKIKYGNGMRIGNPFNNKSADEILDKLGGETEETDIFNGEKADTEMIIDSKIASTLLMGEKYYGKK